MSARSNKQWKALAALMDVDSEFIEECLRYGTVRLEKPDSAELARIRRLQRICRSLEVDAFAGSIIVDLLERIEEMQRDLEHWRARSSHGAF